MSDTPPFDRKQVLQRTPEEIQADLEAQKDASLRLVGNVPDSIALAYYKSAVNQPKSTDSLFWQGRFSEAAELAIGQNKREYFEYADALLWLDEKICDCPNIQFKDGVTAKGTSVPARRVIQSVYVGTLKKEVNFIRCDACGNLFAQSI